MYDKKTNSYTGYIYKVENLLNKKCYIGQTSKTIDFRWKQHCNDAFREQTPFHMAIQKYGKDGFIVSEIQSITANDLNDLANKLDELQIFYIKEFNSLISQHGYNVECGGRINKIVPGRLVDKYDMELNFICTYDSITQAAIDNNISGNMISNVCRHRSYSAGGYIWAYHDDLPIKSYKRKKYCITDKDIPLYLSSHGLRNEQIDIYDMYGNLIKTYDNAVFLLNETGMMVGRLYDNLTGKVLANHKTVIRYHSDPFDKYPQSKRIRPFSAYDLYGKHVMDFLTLADAEKHFGISRSQILKSARQGTRCHDMYFTHYGDHFSLPEIEMCDDDWNVIKTFKNKQYVYDYFGGNTNNNMIEKAVNNHTKYHGYYWRIKEVKPVEKEETLNMG